MDNNKNINISRLFTSDIDKAMELVLTESWNQTEKDWEIFIGNSQNICLKAEIDSKLVGTATAINYANQQAWIGMVLVNRAHRGKGIAKMLMNSILSELESFPSVKLDATPAGQRVYEKIGFAGEYSIDRMVNPALNVDLIDDAEDTILKMLDKDFQDIVEFDKNAFGICREDLLNYLSKDFPNVGWMIKREDMLDGFVLGRQGNKHFQIGPVSANSVKIAKSLISNVLKDLNGISVVVDVLSDKIELINWLKNIGFVKKRDFIRMYWHSNPYPGRPELQYLICGPEFG